MGDVTPDNKSMFATQVQGRRGWVYMLIFSAIMVGIVSQTGMENPVGLAASTVAIAVSLIIMVSRAFRMPQHSQRVWWLLIASTIMTIVGEIVYVTLELELNHTPPLPNMSDLFYMSSYVFGILAIYFLIRAMHPEQDLATWVDTIIISLAMAAYVIAFILGPIIASPYENETFTRVAMLYPALDVIVLAALIRLSAIREIRTRPSILWVTASFATYLTADLVYNSAVVHRGTDGTTPSWLAALYILFTCLMAVAMLAPGARNITNRVIRDYDEADRFDSVSRIVGLAVGAISVPLLLLVLTLAGGTNPMIKIIAVISAVVVVLVLVRVRMIIKTVEMQAETLAEQARTDSLTGLPNRRTWDHHLARLEEEVDFNVRPITIALLDLDWFKDYNDTHGHQAADYLLADCAKRWEEVLPHTCFLARYGGEEFCIAMSGVSMPDAEPILETVREATPDLQTVSIGYAQHVPGETLIDTLANADRAMYTAKRKGRNRVEPHRVKSNAG